MTPYPNLSPWTTCGFTYSSSIAFAGERTYHFRRVAGIACLETNWLVRVTGVDDVELVDVWGDGVPIEGISWGALKSRF